MMSCDVMWCEVMFRSCHVMRCFPMSGKISYDHLGWSSLYQIQRCSFMFHLFHTFFLCDHVLCTCYVLLCDVMLCCVMWCYVMSYHVMYHRPNVPKYYNHSCNQPHVLCYCQEHQHWTGMRIWFAGSHMMVVRMFWVLYDEMMWCTVSVTFHISDIPYDMIWVYVMWYSFDDMWCSPMELFSQLHALYPHLWNQWKSFSIRYCDGHQVAYGWESKVGEWEMAVGWGAMCFGGGVWCGVMWCGATC